MGAVFSKLPKSDVSETRDRNDSSFLQKHGTNVAIGLLFFALAYTSRRPNLHSVTPLTPSKSDLLVASLRNAIKAGKEFRDQV